MKKGLIFVFCILSFLGINTVSAETTTVISNYYDHFEEYVETYNTYKENIDYMVNYWKENYSIEYPYYSIELSLIPNSSSTSIIKLFASKTNYIISYSVNNKFGFSNAKNIIVYYINSNTYDTNSSIASETFFYNEDDNSGTYNNHKTTLIHNGLIYNGELDQDTQTIVERNFSISSYYNESFELNISDIELKKGSVFPTVVSLYEGSYNYSIPDTYQEINLNNYSYVILSLKDYSLRDTFTSDMYVKGQLCPTTVYNYGLEEKKDYISGYQTQPCSPYFNNFTPFLSYIKSEDIINHAVYYLTSYDYSKPNLVKVDTSVYNITYITSENENEPYVFIEGKNYPALPYSSLTDSATLTEKNGIKNTWTCAKYDTNCYLNSSGIDIDNLFQNPLETLKTIWNAIISIFELIAEFILLLPPTMQAFLYLAFGVGIALGIIKILL